MRLAHIAPPWIPVPPVTYGGTELMVSTLVQGLRQGHLEVLVFCAGDSRLAPPTAGPFPRSFWPPEKFSENLHLGYAWRFLQQHPVDLVHSHLESAAGFWQALGQPLPLLITLHTPITDAKRDYLLHFPQVHLVAVSDFQRRRLAGHPRISLIPHGLEVEAYPLGASKEDYFLFLGRIYPEKGLHTAIRLAQETGQRLVCAGPVFAPDRPYFEKEIAPHLDGRRLVYVGPADFSRKLDLLGRARALLLPLEVDEAFGLVMVEAMACGTPVIASARGATPEVIVPGVTGFLAHSPADFIEAMQAVAHLDPQACRRHVAQHFSQAAMVAAYLELYRQVLAEWR
ncbi:MAG: glycosyltransferase family 4 protein [Desulfobacca sp.]|uniref:glycosyltransferase family 4 protein n=1 Tax=Desulfobacca sp. TaxID=2067990 RepID=UPI00404AEB83